MRHGPARSRHARRPRNNKARASPLERPPHGLDPDGRDDKASHRSGRKPLASAGGFASRHATWEDSTTMPVSSTRILMPTKERNFGRHGDTAEIPPLTDIQTVSY